MFHACSIACQCPSEKGYILKIKNLLATVYPIPFTCKFISVEGAYWLNSADVYLGYSRFALLFAVLVSERFSLPGPVRILQLIDYKVQGNNASFTTNDKQGQQPMSAYLEVKIWSLPKHENLTTCKIYCGKEKQLLLRSNFSSFRQYFQYISNFKSNYTYIC